MCSPYSGNARVGNAPAALQAAGARWEHGGNLMRLRPRGGAQVDDEPRVEVHYDEMTFFTHQVNGQTYGGWYRQLAPRELEIMGAGFMCKTPYAGCDELSVARSVLEDHLRGQMQIGARPQSLDTPDPR
jgi:hypothetical protein